MNRAEAARCAREAKAAKAPTLHDRFWSKVERRGETDCWPWTAAARRSQFYLYAQAQGAGLSMDTGLTIAQHAERCGVITGSRVGTILGLNLYATRTDCMREMVREHFGAPREWNGNEATRWGQQHEVDNVAAYEARTGELVLYSGPNQVFYTHPDYPWLGVHPDGITATGRYFEAKSPYRARYRAADDNYQAQIQLGMECARHYVKGFKDIADFSIWWPDDYVLVEYPRDPNWLPRVLPALREFMDEFRAIIGDESKAAPYLADKERDDETWRNLVSEWRDAKRQADEAAAREKRARADLVNLAPHGAKGCGVTVSRVETEGRIDYKRAITQMLPDVDLSPFKGQPSVSYRITESKP